MDLRRNVYCCAESAASAACTSNCLFWLLDDRSPCSADGLSECSATARGPLAASLYRPMTERLAEHSDIRCGRRGSAAFCREPDWASLPACRCMKELHKSGYTGSAHTKGYRYPAACLPFATITIDLWLHFIQINFEREKERKT